VTLGLDPATLTGVRGLPESEQCPWGVGSFGFFWRYIMYAIYSFLISSVFAFMSYMILEKPSIDAKRIFKNKYA
jgi:hypothetical protein